MKIKKWLGVAALATVAGLTLAACGNSEKKADNETVVKIATVNRSGSEEARWDKIQELRSAACKNSTSSGSSWKRMRRTRRYGERPKRK